MFDLGSNTAARNKTSRTDRIKQGHFISNQEAVDVILPKDSPSFSQSKRKAYDKFQSYGKGSNFVSLNPNDNKCLKSENEWLSKTGDNRDTGLSNIHQTQSYDTTEHQKLSQANQSSSQEVQNQPRTSYLTNKIRVNTANMTSKGGKFPSSRINSFTKNPYNTGKKNFQTRENNMLEPEKIGRQRSETNHVHHRKHKTSTGIGDFTNKNNLAHSVKVDNHVTKFSFATKAGKSLRNPRKKNQDQYIVEPMFLGMKDVHFFGICDGHGINGKFVSTFIKTEMPRLFEQHLHALLSKNNGEIPSSKEIKLALEVTFHEINDRLYSCAFDIKFSGST